MSFDLSVTKLIKDSWVVFKVNWKFLLLSFLIYLGILYLIPVLLGFLGVSGKSIILDILVQVVISVLSILFATGWTKIYLKLADGGKPEYSDLYNYPKLAVLYFLNVLVAGLFIGGIALLLIAVTIFPGIAIAAATKSSMLILPFAIIFVVLLYFLIFISSLIPYITVDKKLYPIATIKRAFNITKGKRIKLCLVSLVLFLFMLSGLIFFIIGVLITGGIGSIAYAKLYRTLDPK